MTTLVDAVPGNIGLVADDDTVIFLPFDEIDTVLPSERIGTLEDMGAAETNVPAVDSTVAWEGATSLHFTGQGLDTVDKSTGSSLLLRDCTIQAIVAFAAPTGTPTYCIISRGRYGLTAADYACWGLEVRVVSGSEFEARFFWADVSGTEHTIVSSFTPPPVGEFVLLTATRRVEAYNSVTVRLYLNDELLGEDVSTAGTVGGGTLGVTSVGCRWLTSAYGNFFKGWIDTIKVTSHEMSAEEIRATWDRMTKHQPNGVASLRAIMPPGMPALRPGPDSDIGRIIKQAGQAIGFAASRAHEFRTSHFPQWAYKEKIATWEHGLGLQTDDRASLDSRRSAVVTALSRENGFLIGPVLTRMATPFVQDSANVTILRFNPRWSELFTSINEDRWMPEPSAAWSISANALVLSRSSSDDIRFEPSAGNLNLCRIRTSIESDEGLILQCQISGYSTLPTSVLAGLFLFNRRTNDAMWFGVYNDAGTKKLGWRKVEDGTLGAFNTINASASASSYYLRLRKLTDDGAFTLEYSTTGFTSASMTSTDVTGAIASPVEWIGFGATTSNSTVGGTLSVTFDTLTVVEPQSHRAFNWYAYRDLGDPGTPDMIEADRIIKLIKPAHTHAAAITSLQLLCDDEHSLCDAGPMGGF